MKIKGVNFGNWLVLEKWMNRALFDGTKAEDEYWLARDLTPEAYAERMRIHRSEYITERDFTRVRALGMNVVRIPVPYFIFGDREPFIGCVQELDKAFLWAEKYGLQILIDLHTAPYSQNGFDNGGICGVCTWAQRPDEVRFELSVLERLAARYGKRKGLFGIEAINEPAMGDFYEKSGIAQRYQARDPEMAKGSRSIPQEFLKEFYADAYDTLRRQMAADKFVVFHDGFDLPAWKGYVKESGMSGVILDTHRYLMVEAAMGYEESMEGCIKFLAQAGEEIRSMQEEVPVICGEWCLFNAMVMDPKKPCSEEEKKEIYRRLYREQKETWALGSGDIYWSWKLLIDSASDPAMDGWQSWDLGRCSDFGWTGKV